MQLDDLIELNGYSSSVVGQYTIELIDPTKDKETAKLINFKYGEKLKAVSSSSFSNQLGSIIDTLRLLVIIIASIAVIVAGIAILNTMLMSVTERFKEIGTLKATGWASSDIVKMILMESAMISIIGSSVGILLGYVVSNSISAAFKVAVVISPGLLSQAIIFAIVIGLISGIYPAYVASKLDPVTVLIAE
jgi:putative ABC transport system permease protein